MLLLYGIWCHCDCQKRVPGPNPWGWMRTGLHRCHLRSWQPPHGCAIPEWHEHFTRLTNRPPDSHPRKVHSSSQLGMKVRWPVLHWFHCANSKSMVRLPWWITPVWVLVVLKPVKMHDVHWRHKTMPDKRYAPGNVFKPVLLSCFTRTHWPLRNLKEWGRLNWM